MMLALRSIVYLAWLGKEIISGTLDVVFNLFKTGDYGKPMIVEVPMRCVTDVEITLFASSITITPGTLVVATGPGTATAPPTLFVHSMFGESEEEVLEGLFDMESRLLRTLRGRAPGEIPESAGLTAGDGDANKRQATEEES